MLVIPYRGPESCSLVVANVCPGRMFRRRNHRTHALLHPRRRKHFQAQGKRKVCTKNCSHKKIHHRPRLPAHGNRLPGIPLRFHVLRTGPVGKPARAHDYPSCRRICRKERAVQVGRHSGRYHAGIRTLRKHRRP